MHKLRTLVLIVVTLSVQFQAQSAQAQVDRDTRTKLIDVQIGPGSENLWYPVWITKVEIGNQFLLNIQDTYNSPLPGEIVRGQSFIAGNDWLKNMNIYVINRAELPVAWLSIALKFPQTGNGSRSQPVWIYNIQMGRMPDVDAVSGRTGKPFPPDLLGSKFLGLQPGGGLTIHVADYMDKIEAYLKTAMPASAVSQVDVWVDVCLFETGLRFSGGAFSRPDPEHPGQWIYFPTRQFFPGNVHKYMPNVITQPGERPQQR